VGGDAESIAAIGDKLGNDDITKDDRITLDGELVTVVAVTAIPDGFECIVKSPTRGLVEVFLRPSQVAEVKVASHDGAFGNDRVLSDADVELLATFACTSLRPAT
jgi:hypothetical protein